MFSREAEPRVMHRVADAGPPAQDQAEPHHRARSARPDSAAAVAADLAAQYDRGVSGAAGDIFVQPAAPFVFGVAHIAAPAAGGVAAVADDGLPSLEARRPVPAPQAGAHGGETTRAHPSPMLTILVANEDDLNSAIVAANAEAAGAGAITIEITGGFTLTTGLSQIDLKSGNSLTIAGTNGAGAPESQTIDGGGGQRGLFVYAGAVTVKNLALDDMSAVGASGGDGGGGGGGGAGLGGALFITGLSDGVGGSKVILDNVSFKGDAAAGGDGGAVGSGGSGGGGGGGQVPGGSGGAIGSAGAYGGNGAAGVSGGNGGSGGVGGVGGSVSGFGAGGGGGGGGGTGGGGGAGGQSARGGSGGNGGIGGKGGNGGFGGGGGGAGPGGYGGAGGTGGYGGNTTTGGGGGTGGSGGGGGNGGSGGGGGRGGFGGGGGGSGGFGGGGGPGAGGSRSGGGGSGGQGGQGGAGGRGGGGLGAGGDIFVQAGGSLTIEGGTLDAGTVTPGAGAVEGAAYGSGVFIEGDQTLTVSPGASQTVTIDGEIADMTGSGDASGDTGAGSLVMNGKGVLVLDADNTFTGGLRIAAGSTVQLAASGAGGLGPISGAGTLALTGGAQTFDTAAKLTVAKVSQSAAGAVASFTSNLGYTGIWTQTAGTVSIAAGDLLNLTGAGDVFAGTLAGAGTVDFGNGADTLRGSNLQAAHVDVAGAKVTLTGAIVNDGAVILSAGEIIVAVAGATLSGTGTVTMTNLATNEITGGSAASRLTIYQAIKGAGRLGGGAMTLVVGASGLVEATGSVALTINTGATTITNAGVIEAVGSGGATIASPVGNIGQLIAYTSAMTLNGAVNNAGKLFAYKGNLTVNGAVSGIGAAQIYTGILDFTAASSFNQNVTFIGGATGTLQLGHSRTYAGTISGFSRSGATVLDLVDIAFVSGTTKASFVGTATAGVLTVTSGSEVAHIHLTGDFTASTWTLSAAAGGGTRIVDPTKGPAPPASHASASPPILAAQAFAQSMAGIGAARAGPMAAPDNWRSSPTTTLASPQAA